MKRTKSFFLIGGLLIAALMGACASKIPLSEPAKVEDHSVPVSNSNAGSTVQGVRSVKTVDATPAAKESLNHVIYFDFDSYVIKPEFQALLTEQAKQLVANRAAKVTLAGHTDDLGGREYNIALGQKRAEAVKRALSFLGVAEGQLEAVSFGKEKPAVLGSDDEARAKNRRVEISFH